MTSWSRCASAQASTSRGIGPQPSHLGQDLPDDLLVALRLRPGQHQQVPALVHAAAALHVGLQHLRARTLSFECCTRA